MSTAPQARNERGQVLSSVVAVAAVVAVVIGLLVLFGTGGPGGSNNVSSSGSGATNGTPSATSAPPSSQPPSTAPPPTTVPVSTPPPAMVTQPGTTVTAPQPTKTVTKTAQPQATKGPALGPRPSIEIYNNTRERGLAERTAGRAESAGWRVAGVDNWIGKIVTTTVYYPLGMSGHATQLASDLGIGHTKAALSNMKTDRLTVILTTDYAG